MSNNFDSLGDRMKGYENVYNHKLIRRLPVIIRLDGRAFHTLTKNMIKPYDLRFSKCMLYATIELVKEIQGSIFAYTQSDEISILLQDWKYYTTEAWFDSKVQKMVSVSASIATRGFNELSRVQFQGEENKGLLEAAKKATFDSRVFNLPFEEVNNYFLWRQNDATRNSVNALAQSEFSHKELQGINVTDVKEKLIKERNIDWEQLDQWKQMGYGVMKGTLPPMTEGGPITTIAGVIDLPSFSKQPEFINGILQEITDAED